MQSSRCAYEVDSVSLPILTMRKTKQRAIMQDDAVGKWAETWTLGPQF